jgi:glycosyltransferase involved in cell wall biosynthesis
MKILPRIAAIGARSAWLRRNRSAFGQFTRAEQPHLFVDVSSIIWHDARTGIQRVVRAVSSELARRSGNGFVFKPVFATHLHGYCHAPADFLAGIGQDWIATPASVRPGDRFLGLDLAAHVLPRYRRQLAAWKAHGATIHLMVYDLLPMLRPDWFNASTASNFRRWLRIVVNEADQAICISDHVAKTLAQNIVGQARPRIARMQMGADIRASVPSTGISSEISDLLDRLRFKPAVLMVGTIEPRKGYDVALDAFDQLWRTYPSDAPDLVIVGKPGWKTSALQQRLKMHPHRGSRLHWLTNVTDEALSSLYEGCAGVFIASRGEGFGLPLAEAAMFRRQVLARDLPVFREQRLQHVSFFTDDSPAGLGPRLIALAKAGAAGPAPVTTPPSWSDCVEDLLRQIGLGDTHFHETEAPLRRAS